MFLLIFYGGLMGFFQEDVDGTDINSGKNFMDYLPN
jgi:hypothetical protein